MSPRSSTSIRAYAILSWHFPMVLNAKAENNSNLDLFMSLRWQKTENPIILKNWSKLIKRCFNCQNFKRGRETIFVPCNLCQLISKDLLTIHRLASIHHTYKHSYNTIYILCIHASSAHPHPPLPTFISCRGRKVWQTIYNLPQPASPVQSAVPCRFLL